MPGLLPYYRPAFSRQQLEEAAKLVRRRRAPQGKAMRARLVLLLAENPTISNPAAARLLGVHENTVYNWRKRWATQGWTLSDHPRSGRPVVFSLTRAHGRQGRRVRTARAV